MKNKTTTTDKNFKKETTTSTSWDQKKQQGGIKTPQRDINIGHKTSGTTSGTADIKSRTDRH